MTIRLRGTGFWTISKALLLVQAHGSRAECLHVYCSNSRSDYCPPHVRLSISSALLSGLL